MGKLKSTWKRATDWIIDPAQDAWGKIVPDATANMFDGLFEGPKMPDIPEATPMPEPDSDEVRRARRRSMIAQRGRGGRESTILTDTLG
jgi:hypothetical protein